MTIEDTLRDALQRDAADLVPVGSGPDTARRRASLRKRRMQSGVVVLGACALVGGTLGVIETRPAPSGPRIQTASTATKVTPALSWRSVDGTVSNDFKTVTSSDGVIYELSTAPGAGPSGSAPLPQELYRTTNGVDWTHTSVGATPWISDLAESNGVLYAVGTGPGTQAGTTAYKLSTSSDAGANWTDDSVPVDFTKPASNVPLQLATSVHVARGAHTTVVMATGSYQADFSSVLGSNQSLSTTALGVQVLDMSACRPVVAAGAVAVGAQRDAKAAADGKRCKPTPGPLHPWSEFGISDPSALNQQQVLVRDDGGNWQPVALPGSADTYTDGVTATSNGFLIAEQNQTGATSHEVLWSSADGRSWSQLANVPSFDSVSFSGDKIIGTDSGSSTIYVSNDAGSTWTSTTNVADLVPGSGPIAQGGVTVDAGPLGYAALVSTGTGNVTHAYLLHSSDGVSWQTTDLATVGEASDADATGVTVGADHISVSLQQIVPGPNASATTKITDLVATPKA